MITYLQQHVFFDGSPKGELEKALADAKVAREETKSAFRGELLLVPGVGQGGHRGREALHELDISKCEATQLSKELEAEKPVTRLGLQARKSFCGEARDLH